MNWQWTSIERLSKLDIEEYNALQASQNPDAKANTTSKCGAKTPFLQYAFLSSLETANCVGANTGWQAQHLIIRDGSHANEIVAFIPAYIKTHSYGEYVFDHSWAHAYQQHGLSYYPKLSICVPFTPVTGPRLLHAPHYKTTDIISYLASKKAEIMSQLGLSSIHWLFAEKDTSANLQKYGFHQRQSVQFNWYNKSYSNYNDFIQTLTARRRRSIKKERAGITKQGVDVFRLVDEQISAEAMAFFYTCYQQTYLKRSGHHGYLNAEFFESLLAKMPQNLLLIIAQKGDTPIASALFLYDERGLYGRYWGALEDVSGLHFEVCYYQGIEFCIENNITVFNPGTQGEHKILRGFEPTLCFSNHAMAEPAFDDAVKDFLQRETPHIVDYLTQSAELLPFKDEQEKN